MSMVTLRRKSPSLDPTRRNPPPHPRPKPPGRDPLPNQAARTPRPRPERPPRQLKRPLSPDLFDSLPSANLYEKSYMHGDVVVTHVAVFAAEVFITGSADGHIKFWKIEEGTGIEFVKHHESHLGPIEGLAVSVDGMLCCTVSNCSVNIYDAVNYDMRATISLPFVAGCAEWVYKEGKQTLAISDRDSPSVHIYDALSGSNVPNASGKIQGGPIKSMKYNPKYNTVISGDDKGVIEYWIPDTFEFPKAVVDFTVKRETHLLGILLLRLLNMYGIPEYKLEDIEFKRRMAVEEELEKEEIAPLPNAIFDESSNFLIYATHLGIKVEDLHDRTYSGVFGMQVKDARFLRIALYQSERSRNKFRKMVDDDATNVNERKDSLPYPTLLCCAFKKNRIYLFSRREPEDASKSEGREIVLKNASEKEEKKKKKKEEEEQSFPEGS